MAATTDEQRKRQLYSRQEYVIGAETQAKYGETDVLIVGMSGLGCEIAKNLVLTGVRSVSVIDDAPLSLRDLGTNFLAAEDDIGRSRSQVVVPKLAEMNRLVSVRALPGPVTEEHIRAVRVVVFVDQGTTRLTAENEFARRHGVKFVACESRGLSGCVFVDGGERFVVHDVSGEDTVSCIVTAISKDGTVYCHEDKKHECEVGSRVFFTGVQKPTSLNSADTKAPSNLFPVKEIVGPFALKVDVGALPLDDVVTGTAAYLHTTKTGAVLSFRSLSDSVVDPLFNFIIDADEKLTAGPLLHAMFRAAHEASASGVTASLLPRVEHFLGQALDEGERGLVAELLEGFGGEFHPMSCIIGGIASQEALKLASGMFTPLQQWLYYDMRELLRPSAALDRTPSGTRFDGLVQAVGREVVEQIQRSTAFIVGAGALGCEHIKNAALLGFAGVSITDMDTIETSNLSRQFLFRDWHVGQAKSTVAASAAQAINRQMRITSFVEKVGRDTEHVFPEAFWLSHAVVLNALDNVPARMYVDEQCVFHKLPLFESGTLGTKCNVQVVIPHLTESYGSSADPPEKSIPLCTLKHFPNAIEHTIQWARDLFHQLFHSVPLDTLRCLQDRAAFYQSLENDQATKPLVLKAVRDTVLSWPTTFSDCVALARLKFEELFHHSIAQLLHNCPLDKVNDNGEPFWSGARKPPRALTFDPNNALHVDFVLHTAHLLASVFHVARSNTGDDEAVRKATAAAAASVVVPPFVPLSLTYSTDPKESTAKTTTSNDAEVATVTPELLDEALAQQQRAGGDAAAITPAEFEKDDDDNHHVAFVTAASNLRASNYSIPLADFAKTKMIAGNIIPAMVTTTSLVTGFVMAEAVKFLGGARRLSQYRNAFVNIAPPSLVLSDPVPVAYREYVRSDGSKVRWSLWDRLEVPLPATATVLEVVQYLEREHQLDVFMMALPSGKTLYASFGARKDVNRPLRDVARDRGVDIDHVTCVTLVVSGTINDVDVDVPSVRFLVR